ncbi:MAG: archaellin/type IV pilin N-terminal domain-containing protein [Methanosarcinales archaeon]
MRSQRLFKNDEAFTGLEAAIVLTAFIVVAAVFAYVVLGAGFFTTQKSKEVIHTGTEQATSSVELAGDVIATAWNDTDPANNTLPYTEVRDITIFVELTAGQNPADLVHNRTVLSYKDENDYIPDLYQNDSGDYTNYSITTSHTPDSAITWIINDSTLDPDNVDDDLLESGEKAAITVNVTNYDLKANKEFTLELKPSQGATLYIKRTLPPALDAVMDLK